jgi:hypothetical protein
VREKLGYLPQLDHIAIEDSQLSPSADSFVLGADRAMQIWNSFSLEKDTKASAPDS